MKQVAYAAQERVFVTMEGIFVRSLSDLKTPSHPKTGQPGYLA
jgi:hypothetical protein